MPYFFSDQYDLGMEYTGWVGPAGTTGWTSAAIRQWRRPGSFRAFWVRDGAVVAGMNVNDWDASDVIRESVGTRR